MGIRVVATIVGTLIGAAVVLLGLLVAGQIPAKTLRTLRLFGVSQCLHLEKS